MATIRAYTTIEQSKKLAVFLPIESADMGYNGVENRDVRKITYDKIATTMPNMYSIPCWSLASLLNIIPKHIKEYNTLRIDIDEKGFSIWYDEIGYGVNTELPDITMESTVDACVEMIIKLHELNLL